MSDLISRKYVIEKLENILEQDLTLGETNLVSDIVAYIMIEPAAYDIDKIVEELETDSSVKLYGSGNSDNYLIPVKRAIEIVKQGDVSDDVCEWEYNDTEYYWESSCDHLHIFMADGPKENEYDFCPYCGKKIKVVE